MYWDETNNEHYIDIKNGAYVKDSNSSGTKILETSFDHQLNSEDLFVLKNEIYNLIKKSDN